MTNNNIKKAFLYALITIPYTQCQGDHIFLSEDEVLLQIQFTDIFE